MPPQRDFQERAAIRRRTNVAADHPPYQSKVTQQKPCNPPWPKRTGTPELISTIKTALTQGIQAANAAPSVQFVPDPQKTQRVNTREQPHRNDRSTESQAGNLAAGTIQTIEKVFDKVIGPQDTPASAGNNTFISETVPLSNKKITVIIRKRKRKQTNKTKQNKIIIIIIRRRRRKKNSGQMNILILLCYSATV